MRIINLQAFILFDNIRQDELIQRGVNSFRGLEEGKEPTALAEDYFFVQRGLLANLDEQDMQGTYWQSYLCKRIVESENKFSLMAELG
ncbi:MAG: hypothetical protein RR361_09275, partial [Anaerovorax sp.]